MKFEFYNPHPKKKIVGDCVKRALARCSNKEYNDISLELNRLKKISGADKYNEDKNWKYYVKQQGWPKLSFPAAKGVARIRVKDFIEMYPEGKYLLNLAKHLTVVEDGVLYDTWDCGSKMVYNAWEC